MDAAVWALLAVLVVPAVIWLLLSVMIYLTVMGMSNEPAQFIYFQF